MSSYQMHVDVFTHEMLAGWTVYVHDPAVRVAFEVWIDGRFQSVVFARNLREDLRDAGIGDGCYSFECHLPRHLAKRPKLELELRVFPGGEVLATRTATKVRKK